MILSFFLIKSIQSDYDYEIIIPVNKQFDLTAFLPEHIGHPWPLDLLLTLETHS